MNTLDWICSRSWPWRPSKSGHPLSSLSVETADLDASHPSFEEIVTRFQTLQLELDEARHQAQQARHQAQQATSDLRRTQAQLSTARTHENNQRAQLRQLEGIIQNLRKEKSDYNSRTQLQTAQINNLQKKLKAQDSLNAGVRSQISNVTSSAAGLQQDNALLIQKNETLCAKYRSVEKQHQEALLELEWLKCVEGRESDPTKLPLRPQSFVVALVDGDAYSWTSSLFQQKADHNPGAFAAAQIRTSVEEFATLHPDISPNAKIVVRVFVNESGTIARRRNMSHFIKKNMNIFMRQFTEAEPLFDFFDSGQGKERADFKIKETFQLFLSNPHCQHIFLATCTDNGFARMLEPYQYHAARNKITLVSPGFVCREIDVLGFNTTEWTNVFSRRQQQPEISANEARKAQQMAIETAHNKRLGFVGTQVPWITASIKDMYPECGLWTTQVNRMIFQNGRSVGVKRPLRISSSTVGHITPIDDSSEEDDEDEFVE